MLSGAGSLAGAVTIAGIHSPGRDLYLAFTAVPEPSPSALVVGGTALAARELRRRRPSGGH